MVVVVVVVMMMEKEEKMINSRRISQRAVVTRLSLITPSCHALHGYSCLDVITINRHSAGPFFNTYRFELVFTYLRHNDTNMAILHTRQ